MDKSARYLRELEIGISTMNNRNFDEAIRLVIQYLFEGTIFIAANGGNFASALHFATDWKKGFREITQLNSNVVVLGENSPLYSASVNDFPPDDYFSMLLEMENYKKGMLLALTAGGKSKNVLNAAKKAKDLDMFVLGITGGEGDLHSKFYDKHIHFRTSEIRVVEDLTSLFGHLVMENI